MENNLDLYQSVDLLTLREKYFVWKGFPMFKFNAGIKFGFPSVQFLNNTPQCWIAQELNFLSLQQHMSPSFPEGYIQIAVGHVFTSINNRLFVLEFATKIKIR